EESYSSAVGDVCGERGVRGGVGRESVARARDEVVAARGDDRGGERKERRARGRAQRPIRDRRVLVGLVIEFDKFIRRRRESTSAVGVCAVKAELADDDARRGREVGGLVGCERSERGRGGREREARRGRGDRVVAARRDVRERVISASVGDGVGERRVAARERERDVAYAVAAAVANRAAYLES